MSEDARGDGVYYSPKPQRVRYDRPPQDQYGVPVYNSYQPLQDDEDQYPNGSFLGKGRMESPHGVRNLEKEGEENSKKKRRED